MFLDQVKSQILDENIHCYCRCKSRYQSTIELARCSLTYWLQRLWSEVGRMSLVYVEELDTMGNVGHTPVEILAIDCALTLTMPGVSLREQARLSILHL